MSATEWVHCEGSGRKVGGVGALRLSTFTKLEERFKRCPVCHREVQYSRVFGITGHKRPA